ncbi:glycosyltransferase [Halomarina ordinaria]|uniref:Glycosyltransferase n=1 Tax=Halomarina ordinaria TaxID=3033939 RepID=A0ABD5U389_9EURY|nr:glycosyltransferase family 2 protein [Halomarina sp. PSRA2]
MVLTGIAFTIGLVFYSPLVFLAGIVTTSAVGLVVVVSLVGGTSANSLFERRYSVQPSVVAPVAVTAVLLYGIWKLDALSPLSTVYATLTVVSVTVLLQFLLRHRDPSISHRFEIPLWPMVVLSPMVGGLVLTYWEAQTPVYIAGLLFLGLIYLLICAALLVPLAVVQKSTHVRSPPLNEPFPTVSVLIPAYNEAGYVGPCIEAVLDSDYPDQRLEIVVVNDGSSDGTYEEAAQYRDRGVSVYHKSNGGKHSALNYGLLCSTGEYVVAIDADSHVTPTAITRLVRDLEAHPGAGAVAGNVKVTNRDNVVTWLQSLEYIVSINTFRRMFGLLGSVPVIPGCLGGFRREALEDVFGYDPDTVTEDYDVTVQLIKHGWRVKTSEATVSTEAPFTWRDLYRQRLRWYQGSFQTMFKHVDVFADDRSRLLHRFVFPFTLLSSVFLPLVTLSVLILVPTWIRQGRVDEIATVLSLFFVLMVAIVGVALTLEAETPRHLLYAPLAFTVYRVFLSAVVIRGLIAAVLDTDGDWQHVRRLAQERRTR